VTEGPQRDPERVDQRAAELLHGGGEARAPVADDESSARAAAERILEESDERVADRAARDLDDDSVIRRSSEETAT